MPRRKPPAPERAQRDVLADAAAKAGLSTGALGAVRKWLAELMVGDALHREESCGGHFREEHQTEDGEAKRDDENFCFASAWEFTGIGNEPALHKEALEFREVHLATRSYK